MLKGSKRIFNNFEQRNFKLLFEIVNYRNLVTLAKNLPNLLLKRRRLIVFFIFTLTVLVSFSILKNTSDYNNITEYYFEDVTKIKVAEYERLKNDHDLDTSFYNEEYNKYSQIKANYKYKKDNSNSFIKIVLNNTRRRQDVRKNTYSIMEYTKVFEKNKFCGHQSNELYVNECKYKNCYFTCEKNETSSADALLFHESDLKMIIKNNGKKILDLVNQRENKSDQIWILWNDEANKVPALINTIIFNWTLSYRLDAEISDCAYGCAYKRPLQKENSNYKAFLDELRVNYNRRRTSSIWFVSNCISYYRIEFALDFSQYFPTNILGDCAPSISLMKKYGFKPNSFIGKIIFPIYNLLYKIKCDKGSSCEINTLMNSKFYLSFESKNCSFYITEKFWSILRLGLIPVVIQPSKVFYEYIAPKDSFIHAEDFNFNPQKLAAYMNRVSNDFNLYSKYLLWKFNDNIAHSSRNCEGRRLCELCTKLNEETSKIYYKNTAEWFNNDCKIN